MGLPSGVPLARRPYSLLAALPALAPALLHGSQAPAPAIPELSPEEWAGLKSLALGLSTEAGTREVFLTHPALGNRFSTLDQFLDYIGKWRYGISPLPDTLKKALEEVDIQVLDKPDGTAIYVTYYLRTPPNALVHLRTVWVNGTLARLECLKGFAKPQSR